MVEDVHFTRAILPPGPLGRRAATIAVSDVAAMGGTPRWVLAACSAPPGSDGILAAIGSGLAARASELGAALVGGNLTRSDRLHVCITVAGTVEERPMTRAGARPGDLLALTGPVGGASLGLELLLAGRVDPACAHLAAMWQAPPARVEAGRALRPLATAAIDVSDGLLQDVGHVIEASGTGARIEVTRLPLPPGYMDAAPADDPYRPALVGGEDYELVLAVPPASAAAAHEAALSAGCELTFVGEFTDRSSGLVVIGPDGRERAAGPGGWDHFGPRT
jgi:thiamine-monophosphate kinase